MARQPPPTTTKSSRATVKVMQLDGTIRLMRADLAREAFHRGSLDWDLDGNCYKQARHRKPYTKKATIYPIRRTRA